MTNEIKAGDIVVYKGGLFRVRNVKEMQTSTHRKVLCVFIGDIVTDIRNVRKADWRDEVNILKRK